MRQKYSIDTLKQLAKKHNGKCISKVYRGYDFKYDWECSEGHIFSSLLTNVVTHNSWCKICASHNSSISRRGSFSDILTSAKKSKLKILSKESDYKNNKSKIEVQCLTCNQIETKTAWGVKSGYKCNNCSRVLGGKKKIENHQIKLKNYLMKYGLSILSRYSGGSKDHEFKCNNGHKFYAKPNNVISSQHGCPLCLSLSISEKMRTPISKIRNEALNRGGKLISKVYEGNSTQIEFQCIYGHKFKTTWQGVKQGSWCPSCSTGLGERIVKSHFEYIFSEQFNKIRPEWLRTKDGVKLELDGYNERLGIAFEHQGHQHYRISRFTPNKKSLEKRQNADLFKRKQCKKNNVILIEVPEINYLLPLRELPEYLLKQFKLYGLKTAKKDFVKFKLTDAYKNTHMDKIEQIVSKKRGKLISKAYLGMFEKLDFQCVKKHNFSSSPNNIIHGRKWCPYCSGSKRLNYDDVNKIVSQKNGRVLDIKNSHEIKIKCKEGHTFTAPARDLVQKNRWCGVCYRNRNKVK